jgi:prepilin-type N-terminal cleavage/methylation domain-containing protein
VPTATSALCSNKASRGGFSLLEVLMALFIIAVLAAVLSRILQSSLLSHRQIQQEITDAPRIQAEIDRQFAGELDEPVLSLTPVGQEKK